MALAKSTPTKVCRSRRSPVSDLQPQASPCLGHQSPVSLTLATGRQDRPHPARAKVCPRPRSRNAERLTQAELEALWRSAPDFIGPVAPPMWLWERDRAKQALWSRKHGLR